MLIAYTKPMCLDCQKIKVSLIEANVPFEERTFSLDEMSKENPEDVIALATYHYQWETLPVFVKGDTGYTLSEIKDFLNAGNAWRLASP